MLRILFVIFILSGCVTTSYNNCPVYPLAGENVAKELENISYEQAPNLWEWLGRVDKLKQELDLCK